MNQLILKLALSLMALGLAGAAFAQIAGVPSPDVGAGKRRAAVCFACHGAEGVSKIPGVPHLAGQDRVYLEKALLSYRGAQVRQDPTMTAMAKPLSDRDVVNIAAYFSLQLRTANGQTAAQMLETLQRIKPVAVVSVAEAPAANAGGAAVARSGEAVFTESCAACHATGAAGAPKLGDKAAWAPRLAQGQDTLIQHAMQGFKGMPPKGTCAACSDEEIKSTVAYLMSKAK